MQRSTGTTWRSTQRGSGTRRELPSISEPLAALENRCKVDGAGSGKFGEECSIAVMKEAAARIEDMHCSMNSGTLCTSRGPDRDG